MVATEDELAKKQVQEAVWVWAGRLLVLAVVFGAGFFSAWLLYGSGTTGAPALRTQVAAMEQQILELKNKRVDIEGQLTVVTGRLTECQKNLNRATGTQ
jgi:hypothetical protein